MLKHNEPKYQRDYYANICTEIKKRDVKYKINVHKKVK